MKRLLFAAIAAALALSLGAAERATATPFAFTLDTRAAKTVAAIPFALPYWSGETITITSPAGIESTPVSNAPAVGTNQWSATEGGIWTAANSGEGTVTLVVRYSLFGTQGEGTESDPVKIVDDAELVDLVASSRIAAGGVFAPFGPATSIGTIDAPVGYAAQPLGDGDFMLVAVVDGVRGTSLASAFMCDTVSAGPDRRVIASVGPLPIAYSGDDWAGDETAGSTLFFAGDSVAEATVPCVGTGSLSHNLKGHSQWVITLEQRLGETLVAHIDMPTGLILIFR